MFAFAMCVLVCHMVMPSAYVMSYSGACGIEISYVYMLNNVGDITPPCETPVLNWGFFRFCF